MYVLSSLVSSMGSMSHAADAFEDSSWGLHIMDGAYKIGGKFYVCITRGT